MNFCNIAYAILAYAVGNVVLIPVNAAARGDLDAAGLLIGSMIVGAGLVGLHDVVRIMGEYELTPDAL